MSGRVQSYPLGRACLELSAPVEVGRAPGHFWFPTLHPIAGQEFFCVVTTGADVPQGKWPAVLFLSRDGGASWKKVQDLDSFGHQSIRLGPGRLLLLPYELWPAAPGDRRNARADGTLLTRGQGERVAAEPALVQFLGFPFELADYHQGEVMLLTNGNILPMKDGRLFATLYGQFAGEGENYRVFAVSSDDGGLTWHYRSTVASWADCPGASFAPSESNTARLADGRLLCVYRVESYRHYYKSYSNDDGTSWSWPQKMEGVWSVEPQLRRLENGLLLLSGGRPGICLWVCADGEGKQWERLDLAAHHNALLPDPGMGYSEAFCLGAHFEPYQSTAYTSMATIGPEEVLLCYDRLANGWNGAPGPWGAADAIFCVRVRATH